MSFTAFLLINPQYYGKDKKMHLYGMIRLLMLFLITLGCLSCQKPLNIQRHQQMVLIDSVSLDNELTPKKKTTEAAYYPVYYIGPAQDTIRFGKQLPSHGAFEKFPDIVLRYLDQVTLTVDTSIKLTNLTFYESFSDSNIKHLDSIAKEPAYAIILQNQSDSTLYIGQFNDLRKVVMQYQNRLGKWTDIEEPAYASTYCSTGAKTMFLEPRQVLVAKLIRYKGDFDALCRLKFKNFDQTCYSNTFRFKIDSLQLSKIPKNKF